MQAILGEFLNQAVTAVLMIGVIVLAVFAGHKTRDLVDKKKKEKAGE